MNSYQRLIIVCFAWIIVLGIAAPLLVIARSIENASQQGAYNLVSGLLGITLGLITMFLVFPGGNNK